MDTLLVVPPAIIVGWQIKNSVDQNIELSQYPVCRLETFS